MAHTKSVKVDTPVPFGASMYWWLRARPGYDLESLIKGSRQYDRPYLAWETVRKGRNPFFENGTGFEGYFVGLYHSPEAALEAILETANNMLTSILQMRRYEYGFKSRLMKTLTDETKDPQALIEWSVQLGAALARLRCNVLYHQEAGVFRAETYRLVSEMPPIAYTKEAWGIRQSYVVTSPDSLDVPRMVVDARLLKPTDQELWLVAEQIGKFGHPLVRQFTHSIR